MASGGMPIPGAPGGGHAAGATDADDAMLLDGAASDALAASAAGSLLQRQVSDFPGLDQQLGLPPSWEPGAADQLAALVAGVEGPGSAIGPGIPPPEITGAMPIPAGAIGTDDDDAALALTVASGGGSGGARRQRSRNLRSYSFPGGLGVGSGGAEDDDIFAEFGAGVGASGTGAHEASQMVPLNAVGEAWLPSPRASSGGAARALLAPHRGAPVATAAAAPPPGHPRSQAAVAAVVAGLVQSMGREQQARAQQREAAAAAAAASGDIGLSTAASLGSPQAAGGVPLSPDHAAGLGGGGGHLLRDQLAQLSTTSPSGARGLLSGFDRAALAAVAAASDEGPSAGSPLEGLSPGAFAAAAARRSSMAAAELPDLGLLDGPGGSGDLVIDPAPPPAGAEAAGTEPLRWGPPPRPGAEGGGGAGSLEKEGLRVLQRELNSFQKRQQLAAAAASQQQQSSQQQLLHPNAHLAQLRTASGRLQGWPGPLPQQWEAAGGAAASPLASHGVLPALWQQQQQQQQQQEASTAAWRRHTSDADAEMEVEGGADALNWQQQQQDQEQQEREQDEMQHLERGRQPPADPPHPQPPLGRPRPSGGSSLLGPNSCAEDYSEGGSGGDICLNCTSALFGPRCDGCGHAAADDMALLQGRLPPIPDGPTKSVRQLACHAGPSAPLLAFDPRLLQHRALRSRTHPERPERTSAVMARLAATGLADRCRQVPCRPASEEELLAVHQGDLLREVQEGSARLAEPGARANPPASINHGFEAGLPHILDCYMTAHTAACAALAAGGAASVAAAVARGEAPGGAAIIRPPGHHAESGLAMGFCLVNNAAVAARAAQRAGARRVVILDWDVHHGNGTQEIFESDPSVLYMSLHRHDDGSFFPGTGAACEVGTGSGEGMSVNIPWGGPGAGDADYIAAFTRLLLPITYEFGPDLIIVSAGFDAAAGDPLGGCRVTPGCFGHLTALLQPVAPLVLLLEGGYNLQATAISVEACMRALLGEAPPPLPRPLAPTAMGLGAIARAQAVHSRYWRCLGAGLPRRASAGPGGYSSPAAAAALAARGWAPGSPPPSPATGIGPGLAGVAGDDEDSGMGDGTDEEAAPSGDMEGGLGGVSYGHVAAAVSGEGGGLLVAAEMEDVQAAAGEPRYAPPSPLVPGGGGAAALVAAGRSASPLGAAATGLLGGRGSPAGGAVAIGGLAAGATLPPETAHGVDRWVQPPPSPQLVGLASPQYELPGGGGGPPPVLM